MYLSSKEKGKIQWLFANLSTVRTGLKASGWEFDNPFSCHKGSEKLWLPQLDYLSKAEYDELAKEFVFSLAKVEDISTFEAIGILFSGEHSRSLPTPGEGVEWEVLKHLGYRIFNNGFTRFTISSEQRLKYESPPTWFVLARCSCGVEQPVAAVSIATGKSKRCRPCGVEVRRNTIKNKVNCCA